MASSEASRMRESRHAPHLNRRHDRPLGFKLAPKRVDQGSVREALTHPAQQHRKPIGHLNYLPAAGGYSVHHAVKHYGLHRDLTPGLGRESQHVLFSPLDAIYESEGAPAGTVRRSS